MKRLSINTILFLSPILVLAYPIDLFLSHFLKKSHEHPAEFEVMNDIYSKKINADIAIYGSSRAWVHFNPKIIEDSLHESAYNFGIDGHNFWLEYLRHLEYLKNNRPPRMIILSVDLFSLYKRPDLYKPDQFLPYMLWNVNIHTYTSSYVGFKTEDYLIPLVRYGGRKDAIKTAVTNSIKTHTQVNYRNRGFAGMNKTWNADLDNAMAKDSNFHVILDTASLNLFEQFIGQCRQLNIELVLVYTPEYIGGQSFVKNRADIIKLYNCIAEKHQIPFIDFSNDEICSNRSYFYNSTHLNSIGADLFTRKLVHILKDRKSPANQ